GIKPFLSIICMDGNASQMIDRLAVCGHGNQPLAATVVPADPRHRKLSILDEDLADSLEEFVAVAGPDNGVTHMTQSGTEALQTPNFPLSFFEQRVRPSPGHDSFVVYCEKYGERFLSRGKSLSNRHPHTF